MSPIISWVRPLLVALIVAFALASATFVARPQADAAGGADTATATGSFYDLEAQRLEGEVERLDRYRGQVLLVVNTASRCGHTPQYEGLQALYTEDHARGLEVLGFPSNDFGNQEPGSASEIGAFCKASYGVTFPMFSKVVVNGPDAHPVYAYLTSQPPPVGGPVKWNFQKYLVDRSGHVVKRFDSAVTPGDTELRREIERLLAESPPG